MVKWGERHGRRTGVTSGMVRYKWVASTPLSTGVALWNGTKHGDEGPGSMDCTGMAKCLGVSSHGR